LFDDPKKVVRHAPESRRHQHRYTGPEVPIDS
jgi:hypothetical protein